MAVELSVVAELHNAPSAAAETSEVGWRQSHTGLNLSPAVCKASFDLVLGPPLGGPGGDCYPMLRNSASGPESGLPGRISAGF